MVVNSAPLGITTSIACFETGCFVYRLTVLRGGSVTTLMYNYLWYDSLPCHRATWNFLPRSVSCRSIAKGVLELDTAIVKITLRTLKRAKNISSSRPVFYKGCTDLIVARNSSSGRFA